MQATLFDIQRFSIHDGPGIRTTVFFKGCNLHCFWCHNPESISTKPEVQFLPVKCIGCSKCSLACRRACHSMRDGQRFYDREACVTCGDCVDACPSEALTLMGKNYTVKDVLEIVSRDKPFYKNSSGGMTCSGGEPMLQKDFLLELLIGAKAMDLHTAVDTAGHVPFHYFSEVLPYTDLFLYDLKCMDNDRHTAATGVGNRLILDNIRKLSEAGVEIWVRIPVIQGINDTLENMCRTAEFLQPLSGIKKVELLTFHRLGGGKYESMGKTYTAMELLPATKEEMQALSQPFKDMNITVNIS
ncbi:MAG: glycyl-radical enzyme activating protein [Clostridiales bacterium]|nr:glycyl-radical enzyme activating protein [Clostridiales bacterium]